MENPPDLGEGCWSVAGWPVRLHVPLPFDNKGEHVNKYAVNEDRAVVHQSSPETSAASWLTDKEQ